MLKFSLLLSIEKVGWKYRRRPSKSRNDIVCLLQRKVTFDLNSRGVTTIGAAGARLRAYDHQGPTETIKLIY